MRARREECGFLLFENNMLGFTFFISVCFAVKRERVLMSFAQLLFDEQL
jgi:hypothetical protein